MTIEEELNAYIAEKTAKFGSIEVYAHSGHMQMAESFSATGFLDMIERDQFGREREDRTFDLLTNLGEYVPLIMTTNINVKPTLILEGFQSSMKMFDRGAAYPVIWDRSGVKRNALEHMERSFFQYGDSQSCYETSVTNWTKSNCLMLAVKDLTYKRTRILLCGVIKNEDYKFVMSLRRHNKPIPRSLVTILQDEEFDTTSFQFPAVRSFYRTRLREKLWETNVLIERVPRTVMDSLIYRPDKKYTSFDELKEDAKANWRLLVKSREE